MATEGYGGLVTILFCRSQQKKIERYPPTQVGGRAFWVPLFGSFGEPAIFLPNAAATPENP